MKNLITLLIVLISLTGYSQSEKSQIDSAVVIIHQLTNEYRVGYGLDTLELSEDLNKKAQAHAEWMYKTKRLVHSNEDGSENILKMSVWDQYNTYQPTKQWVIIGLNGWKTSPGHNKNLLLPKYDVAGYGFYLGYMVLIVDKKFTESSWIDSLH
jgi:uncharacterized protein YkwD